MRVRILHPLSGIYDGVSLSRLHPGVVYDLGFGTALWLIAQGGADQDFSRDDAFRLENEQRETPRAMGGGGITIVPGNAVQDDRPPRRRQRKKR